MKKLFHFDFPREEYLTDAAVVACFDNRFATGFGKFLKRIGAVTCDRITVAGGARSLASPEHETDREFVLDQLRKSVKLHGTRRVILMAHSDCGAYGGLKTFKNDVAAEAEHHRSELLRAAETVRAAIPGVQVDAYFVDFDGVWAAAPESGAETAGA